MQCVYLDKCGYTGENLLDSVQPVFVICTHSLTEERYADLKAKHFGKVQADEPKHSKLQARPRQRRMVTAGPIIVRGRLSMRGERKFADYVLSYTDASLAAIEAKDYNHP